MSLETHDGQRADAEMYDVPAESSAPDTAPQLAISLEESKRRTAMLKEFIRDQMVEGEDYGIIPGGSKPTLYKPGAEKLNAIFGLAPLVSMENRIENWEGDFVSYEVKVTLLNKRTKTIEAEGLGSCNSQEKRYKNQPAANVANTIMKMGKKRALVDATLSATRTSSFFTQDIEDMDLDSQRDTGRQQRPAQRPQQPRRDATPGYAARRQEASPQREPGDDRLTDAQHRAVLAIAGRVFGRHSREEDLAKMSNKPIDELTKSEASGLIDQLRGMLGTE